MMSIDEERTLKAKLLSMPFKDQTAYAYEEAIKNIYKSFGDGIECTYDVNSIYVERFSLLDGDWYLYLVTAKKKHDPDMHGSDTWSVWTMNLALGGLHNGHYDLVDEETVKHVFAYKRHMPNNYR